MTHQDHSAFPNTNVDGLSKREYFAALALQGNLASCTESFSEPKTVAAKSVEYADALIDALNAQKMRNE